ncbi:hypothetical protein AWB91_14140 [Mycobacterium paraense]|uniref:Uncharacterized protein n=1 Tax=Mycobacterium paraense TaxID=767916 RepID=A0ABX3VPS8_9MYCO|nr:hypothetical protein AWB91_14140 [Mycobacterium paraense]ORW41172.1 hypothetical protein AWB88_12580 [Mycobacterium paraense]
MRGTDAVNAADAAVEPCADCAIAAGGTAGSPSGGADTEDCGRAASATAPAWGLVTGHNPAASAASAAPACGIFA